MAAVLRGCSEYLCRIIIVSCCDHKQKLARNDASEERQTTLLPHALISQPTAFGASLPNPAQVRSLPVRRRGIFPAGIAVANVLGFTTQNPARVEVATNGSSLPRLIVGKETLIHTRRPESWRSLSETDAALLDFLRNRGESSELSGEETVDKLLGYFRESGRFERLVKVAPSEPPRGRAMLGAIGQQMGQPESRLSVLRKSLNPLSRFDFGSLAALEHARKWQAKECKIREAI
jgi:hypothetical protein